MDTKTEFIPSMLAITQAGEDFAISEEQWHKNKTQLATLLRYFAIPLQENEQTLWLGVDSLENISATETFAFLTGKAIEPVLLQSSSLKYLLQQLTSCEAGLTENLTTDSSLYLLDLEQEDLKVREDNLYTYTSSSNQSNEPIIHLLNEIFEKAMHSQASDIHLEAGAEKFYLRLRIDGVLHLQQKFTKSIGTRLISRLKILAKLDISENRLPQDGRFIFKTAWGDQLDFRIASVPTNYGEKVVLRLQKNAPVQRSFTELGMTTEQAEKLSFALSQPQGLILVTGPTGSGKSITLYTALAKLNTEHKHILTAEDPIEINIEGIIQTQINPAIDLTFAKLLRSFLRLDPDIIMLGEIRDEESAEIALRSAQTGHLVLATLHTNDAPSAIPRLQQMGIKDYEIEKTLLLVIAQRLVRKKCLHCHGQELSSTCTCKDGYQGRIGVYQFLSLEQQTKPPSRVLDYPNLYVSAKLKLEAGITDELEIQRVLGKQSEVSETSYVKA